MADRNLAKEAALSLNALRVALRYDPETGHFIRLTDNSTRCPSGSIAGTLISTTGYRTIRVCNSRFLAHRLAWFYMYGEWPFEIDHINHQKDDNRLINLRNSNRSQNMFNSKGRRISKLGIKNIRRKHRNFSVHISSENGSVYRRTFSCLGQAMKARNAVLQSLIGG